MLYKNVIIGFIGCLSGGVYANPAPEINCTVNPPTSLNWSNCNKSARNISNQEIDFDIFHNTNFQNSNLANSILRYSDLTGANLIGTNLLNASLGYAIWTDGYMCKLASIGICNKMTLDETYEKLQELYTDALKQDNHDTNGFARYFRIVAQNVINQVLPNYIVRFADVAKKHSQINNEDPIDYLEFEPSDQIILLEYDNHNLVAFRLNNFQEYVNSPNFKIRNLVGGNLKLRIN